MTDFPFRELSGEIEMLHIRIYTQGVPMIGIVQIVRLRNPLKANLRSKLRVMDRK